VICLHGTLPQFFLCNAFWFAKKQLFCKCLREKNTSLAIFRWYILLVWKLWHPFLKKIGMYHKQKELCVVKVIRWDVIVSEYNFLLWVGYMSRLFSNMSTSWHVHADDGCTYTLVIDYMCYSFFLLFLILSFSCFFSLPLFLHLSFYLSLCH